MIYATPSWIKAPNFPDFLGDEGFNNKAYLEAEEKYVQEVRDFCKERYNGKYTGELVRFPVADSYAEYMIASLRPLEIVHLETGDAYNYQHINRLKAKDFTDNVDARKRLDAIFTKKK